MRRPGRRLAAALLAGLSLQGCASWDLRGSGGDSEVVEAAGPDLAAAEKNAVASLFDLFVSSSDLPAAQARLSEKILSRAGSFIRKRKVLESSSGRTVIRGLVRLSTLGAEIEKLGLDAGLGPRGRVKVLVALQEDGGPGCALCGPGAPKESPDGLACRDAGCASEALRRSLIRRGFSGYDLSDRLNSGAGSDPEAAAKALGADILVSGTARAEAVPDERLTMSSGPVSGYQVGKAVLELSVDLLSKAEKVPVRVEASAVDLSLASAFAKALENAGDMAGDGVAQTSASAWKVGSELRLTVVGLRDLAAGRRLIADLRALPDLERVSLVSHLAPELRLKVRTGLASDALAATLLGMRGYGFNMLAVGSEFVEVEVLRDRDGEREFF
ncbi:MAG: hypothetical protein HY924_12275 [Elusimicrobia bacterium]|nr:hypothetical protein [Elusimicrobiota bacterium]